MRSRVRKALDEYTQKYNALMYVMVYSSKCDVGLCTNSTKFEYLNILILKLEHHQVHSAKENIKGGDPLAIGHIGVVRRRSVMVFFSSHFIV